MALGSLPQSCLKSASGLFNLMHNLGGAIGIAVSATMLNDRLNLHYLRLNENVTVGRPAIEAMLSRSSAHLASVAGDVLDASQAGLASLHALVLREALTLTFADCFYVLALCFVVGIVSVFFREADHQCTAFFGSALNADSSGRLTDRLIMKKLVVEILACLAMAACAVQPTTHADLSAMVTSTQPADADPTAWWNQFNDPVMRELVASVLDSNLDLQAAVERVKQAQALTVQRRAALLPQLDANAGASDMRQNTPPPLGYVRQGVWVSR